MVIFRSSSFLKRTVWTPEIALTVDDLPWATCPIVPTNRDESVIWLVRKTLVLCDTGRMPTFRLTSQLTDVDLSKESESAVEAIRPEIQTASLFGRAERQNDTQ